MHTFEREQRLILFSTNGRNPEIGGSDTDGSQANPEINLPSATPENNIQETEQQRSQRREQLRVAEAAEAARQGNLEAILNSEKQESDSDLLNSAVTSEKYRTQITQTVEQILKGSKITIADINTIADNIISENAALTSQRELLVKRIQADISKKIQDKNPTGMEKALTMLGIEKDTAHELRGHVEKKEWGKLLKKGLEIFQTVMSTVGDTLAQTFSGFGPDLLQFLPKKLREMAGGNRMEFYRGINTLVENNIVVVNDVSKKTIERPNSTRVLNEYAKLHGPKADVKAPYVSIEKFMTALTEKVINEKGSSVKNNPEKNVHEVTEAQLVNFAKTLALTPDVTPPAPAPAVAPNSVPAAPQTPPVAPNAASNQPAPAAPNSTPVQPATPNPPGAPASTQPATT